LEFIWQRCVTGDQNAMTQCGSMNGATTLRAGYSSDIPPYVRWRTERPGRAGDNGREDR
jgi:hypothetical protein